MPCYSELNQFRYLLSYRELVLLYYYQQDILFFIHHYQDHHGHNIQCDEFFTVQ
jgi:hypothetical protein